MPLLSNVYITTSRALYTAATGGTGQPLPNLGGVLAHLDAPTQAQLFLMPAGVSARYVAEVDTGTDIVLGDIISGITLLDGITPYPIAVPLGAQIIVTFVHEEAPMLLPARLCFLEFTTTSGPATAFA